MTNNFMGNDKDTDTTNTAGDTTVTPTTDTSSDDFALGVKMGKGDAEDEANDKKDA